MEAVDNSIRIEGVSKTYRALDGHPVVALEQIDLTIAPNEFVCVVGKSGCGKTTLLNMIAGFVAPSSGTIHVGDELVAGPGKGKGVVFQQFALFPWLTARRNIEFACKQRGLDAAARAAHADELIALVGLEGFADKYPYELSGGMQQRVAIARTLALDPKVLLMDEPFGALDEMTRQTMQREVLRIWESRRKTVVFITHSVSESVLLADRVVVHKAQRRLDLMKAGSVLRSFHVALGLSPEGDKREEGDFRTPEGHYQLVERNADSDYFLSIRVSYPNDLDRREARARGHAPGGLIMIHGMPNMPTRSAEYYRRTDWTNGCIAVSNADMVDIWLMTARNTPIDILP